MPDVMEGTFVDTSIDSGHLRSGLKSDIADNECSSGVIHGDSCVCASSSDPGPYSARIQSIQERFSKLDVHDVDARVEAEIDASRDHWSQLKRETILPTPVSESETYSDSEPASESAVARAAKNQLAWELEMAKVAEDNLKYLEVLQERFPLESYEHVEDDPNGEWVASLRPPGFFDEWDLDFPGCLIVVSEKPFAEGSQGELYSYHYKFPDGRRSEDLVVKVFKKGTSLRLLQRLFPLGMLGDEETRNQGSFGGSFCNAILGVSVWKDGSRFGIRMLRHWGDLRQLIDRRMMHNHNQGPPFTSDLATWLMRDIAEGMRDLHAKNIVHRDLKSSNVLIGNLFAPHIPDPKLEDGVAWLCCVSDFECSSGVVGTGYWMAPEILLPISIEDDEDDEHDRIRLEAAIEAAISRKSDVYSYGITCYEILTGWIPFQEEGIKVDDYKRLLSAARPKLPGHLEPWIKELLNKCFKHDPSERPEFQEILDILEGKIASSKAKYRP